MKDTNTTHIIQEQEKHELSFSKRFFTTDGHNCISNIEVSVTGTSAKEVREQIEFILTKQSEFKAQ